MGVRVAVDVAVGVAVIVAVPVAVAVAMVVSVGVGWEIRGPICQWPHRILAEAPRTNVNASVTSTMAKIATSALFPRPITPR